MLEKRIREEAGEIDDRLDVAFKRMADEHIDDAPPILEELKDSVSEECYNEYRHIYNGILTIFQYNNGELFKLK